MTDLAKWRGVGSLVVDALEHGSRAVERIQLETAGRPFAVLERIPVVAGVGRAVRVAHTAIVTTTHAAVRLVGQAVGTAIELGLIAAERKRPQATLPRSPGTNR
jgi:hypothetical protein